MCIRSCGEFNATSHGTQKLCRNLSGEERKRVAEKLKSTSSSYYRSQEINNICKNPEKVMKLQYGDLQEAKSVEVLRKVRSESNSSDDFSKDVFEDLMICFEKKLITTLSLPLKIEIICDDYLQILKKKEATTLYFDATGTLMEKSKL